MKRTFKYRALQCVTLILGVYRFRREASAADKLSVLQFTHMACRTLEDTPVFLLRPCKCDRGAGREMPRVKNIFLMENSNRSSG